MARISDMHKKWMKEPKYRKAYEALEEEFVLASAVMDVRNRAPRCVHSTAWRRPPARACASASNRATQRDERGDKVGAP